MTDRFLADDALRPLKAFQRKTVDYVAKRLLSDPDAVRHFLVADEVGLGKTMVARRLPGLLPAPTPDEALEIATIASAVAA